MFQIHSSAFNSLSRDHSQKIREEKQKGAEAIAFNSLSRDHTTPSDNHFPFFCRPCFQLPLSGSQGNGSNLSIFRANVTFNSLSRDHVSAFPTPLSKRRHFLSTPSLGITHNSIQMVHEVDGVFQLPLSGSLDWPILTMPKVSPVFQLPLSGSPSPIPGFFGSPRLSAAAPLRTNDF